MSTAAAAGLASAGVLLICQIGGADGCRVALDFSTVVAFLVWFGYLSIFAAAGMAILALPVTRLLLNLGAELGWLYTFFGFLIGSALTFLIPGPSEILFDPFYYGPMAAVGGLPGALAGFVWWHLNRKHALSARTN